MQNSIGKPLQRVDGRAKVTGRATYSAEQKVPHLAHAVMVMSTVARGRIAGIDTATARRVPGALAVMSQQTQPARPLHRSRAHHYRPAHVSPQEH